jgi:uncharacterized protein (DUF433 family)
MSRGKPITPKDPQKIIDRYLAGETPKAIAGDFGHIDGHAVIRFLKNAGVKIRNRAEAEVVLRERSGNV